MTVLTWKKRHGYLSHFGNPFRRSPRSSPSTSGSSRGEQALDFLEQLARLRDLRLVGAVGILLIDDGRAATAWEEKRNARPIGSRGGGA